MIRSIRTIDAHAAGEPLRLIVEGFPEVKGRTMMEKREWVRQKSDWLRRALMFEPRGHADMYGAILTEPVTPGADAGVLFMHNAGYSTMCGHGTIAVATIALERGLLVSARLPELVFDTPAGAIQMTATLSNDETRPRVERVRFANVPSFVLRPGMMIEVNKRKVAVDIAFGGAFYAIVDAEAVGVALEPRQVGDLRRLGMEIKHAIESVQPIVHPADPMVDGIYGTIFTGPAHGSDADLRNVTIFADAEVDRSPCGTGTSAVMAVLAAMELLSDGQRFVHESIIGTTFSGRIVARTMVGEYEAIVPEIEGSAWITGEHTFLIDDADPLRDGFRIW